MIFEPAKELSVVGFQLSALIDNKMMDFHDIQVWQS